MPEPLQFPGRPSPEPESAPELDLLDPVVEFIAGLLEILEGRQAADWGSLQGGIKSLLAKRPAPNVPPGSTPQEFAAALVEAAHNSEDEGALLAINALRLDSTCADAWSYLGEDCGEEFELAIMLFTLALMTAQETLGEDATTRLVGQFWTEPETQPFMRALEGLANTCQALGDLQTAAAHYSLMIELNPQDHQGARYPLVAILLLAGQAEAAGQLLQIYGEDESPTMTWARALQSYMEKGAGSEADAFLKLALKADPKVAKYLNGEAEVTALAAEDESELESITTAMLLHDAWTQAPKATEWLLLVEKAGPSLVLQDAPPAPGVLFVPPSKAKREGPRSLD